APGRGPRCRGEMEPVQAPTSRRRLRRARAMGRAVMQMRAAIAVVIAGLDPAIHPLRKKFLRRTMDPRVKPAGDGRVAGPPPGVTEGLGGRRGVRGRREQQSQSSLPGLTRQSILFAKRFLRKGWTRGSSPRVTEGKML